MTRRPAPRKRNPLKKFTHPKLLSLGVLLLFSTVSLPADRGQVKAISRNLMCLCGGCNQSLADCNHIGCPNSVPMRAEVAEFLDAGKDEKTIMAAFAEKYGANVLAAPPLDSGFDLLAWAMPFVALFGGTLLVVYFARQWKARWPQAAAAANPIQDHQRLEDELKHYTPED